MTKLEQDLRASVYRNARNLLAKMPSALATVAEVERYVGAIRDVAADDEFAHNAEDRLWVAVMFAIATSTNVDSPGALCLAARKTLDIEFSRWCE